MSGGRLNVEAATQTMQKTMRDSAIVTKEWALTLRVRFQIEWIDNVYIYTVYCGMGMRHCNFSVVLRMRQPWHSTFKQEE